MSQEIELKVPLTQNQYETISGILKNNKTFPGFTYHSLKLIQKHDEYFSLYKSHEERIKNKELRVIRIRTENNKKAYFCIKQKKLKDGIEFNNEQETFIENPDVLRSFFEATGYIKWFEKKKDSIFVNCSVSSISDFEANLEIEKVNGLPYAEIEYTKDDINPVEIRKNLEKILNTLGINPENRDSRSWAEILTDK
ncbi:CYTH domain-containing protein [Treponema sp.]|uniref:CYTH domain-containing protein n=1 Tax=Treponema sp. TaxID=166 RepID=UPI00388F6C70